MNKKRWGTGVIFLILIGLTLSTGIIFSNGTTYFDESIVSAGAFIMLIFATILQLSELNYQREDLRLTKDEMKKHSVEFNRANDLSIEAMKQTKFFELLLLKEKYSDDSPKEEIKALKKYFYMEIHELVSKHFVEIITEPTKVKIVNDHQFIFDMNPEEYKNESLESKVLSVINIDPTALVSDFIKKYYTHNEDEINEMFENARNQAYAHLVGESYERVDVRILKPYLTHHNILNLLKEENNKELNDLSNLYNAQLDEEEKELYRILSNEISIDEIYNEFIDFNFL